MIAVDGISSERASNLRRLLLTYAVRLRLARALVGISRARLAARAELPLEIIDDLERGLRHPFTREARAIADAVELPIDFFRASSLSTEVLLKVFCGETDARARALLMQAAAPPEDAAPTGGAG